VFHGTTDTAPLFIGSDVTIGHSAILHGCTIEDFCLIGMGAIVMDRAHVHRRSMVAAGSVVLEGFAVPEGMLAAGVPAVIKRPLREDEQEYIRQSARHYVRYSELYRG
jgi:carbonic anhydrase/acetyltransferase-like protein (isoleucine patch superfamily)